MGWRETGERHLAKLPERDRSWVEMNVDLKVGDLRQVSREEALRSASLPKTNRFSGARLLRTFVWQIGTKILAGELPSIHSNIRALYYAHSDPLFAQLQLYGKVKSEETFRRFLSAETRSPVRSKMVSVIAKDPIVTKNYVSDLTEDVVADFVRNHVFRYQDPFQFRDDNAEFSALGKLHSGLVFVTEKRGMWNLCQRYGQKYGITVMSSQGNPSWLSLEYLSDQIKAKGTRNVRLAILCDYDPGGFSIAKDFKDKFEAYGLKVKKHDILTKLDLFEPYILENQAEDLTHLGKGKQTQADAWFAQTNGIDGRKAGVHVNLASEDRVDKAVRAWFKRNSQKAGD